MRFLIDAYNLFFYLNNNPSHFLEERQAFIDWFTTLPSHNHYTLVLDGGEENFHKKGHFKDIELIYASKGESADHCIIQLLEAEGSGCVVSNDREIQQACRAYHRSFMSCQEFLKFVNKKREESPSSSSLTQNYLFEHYLHVFEKRLEKQEEE